MSEEGIALDSSDLEDEEIERLKKVNEQLFEENKEQKIEINNLNSTISNINQSNKK